MGACCFTKIISTKKNNKKEKSLSSKRTAFYASYRRFQIWSLPSSIIYYMSKSPSTAKCYEKMVQVCKYFFIKNPILVISSFHFGYGFHGYYTCANEKPINLSNLKSAIWVTENIKINSFNSIKKYPISSTISKIYQCDAKKLHITSQSLSFAEFKILTSKCRKCWFSNLTVMKEDGSILTVEDVVEILPNVIDFQFCISSDHVSNILTSKTIQKLFKIPYFPHLERFGLSGLLENFDIDAFYEYIKKNNKTKIYLAYESYRFPLSAAYKTRLQTIINEIIASENHEFKVPYIWFSGIGISSNEKLWKMHCTL